MAQSLSTATLITNSGVVKVGDVIGITTAAAGNGIVVRRYNSAGDAILGVLVGVEDPATGGQATPNSGTTDTWTVAADNETVGKKFAKVDISRWSVWSANSSAALHTTAAFGLGRWCDPDTGANAGRILESTVTATLAQGRGLVCLGVDPLNTARGLVSIGVESVFEGAS